LREEGVDGAEEEEEEEEEGGKEGVGTVSRWRVWMRVPLGRI